MIFDVAFPDKCGQNGHCVDRIYRQYTHTFTSMHICAQISRKSLNVTFSAANKEIWHLEAIRRAVIFDMDFVINGGQDGHCVNRIYIGNIHTHTHSHTCICAQISYKCHFLRIRKYSTCSCSANSPTSGNIFTVDKYYRDTVVVIIFIRP